jgi:hypothetical protein
MFLLGAATFPPPPRVLPDIIQVSLIVTYLFTDTLSSEVVTDVNFKITILWNMASCTYQTTQLYVTGDMKLNFKQLLLSSVPLAAVSSSLLHASLAPLVQFASSSIKM